MIRVRAVRSFGVGPWLEQHRRGFKMPFLAGLMEWCRAVESLKVDSGAGFNECGGHRSMIVPTGSKERGGHLALHLTVAVVFIRLVAWSGGLPLARSQRTSPSRPSAALHKSPRPDMTCLGA